MEVDQLLEILGRPGRYSLALYLLLCSNYAMVSISHFTMVIYTAPVPHHCAAADVLNNGGAENRNSTAAPALDSCSFFSNSSVDETGPCPNGWVYDALPGESNVLMEVSPRNIYVSQPCILDNSPRFTGSLPDLL